MKIQFYNGLLCLCVLTMLLSTGMVARKFLEDKKQGDIFVRLSDLSPMEIDQGHIETPGRKGSVKQSKHKAFWEKNQDYVGWIHIDNTTINYPVMQNRDYPDYYLDHNFYREKSLHGVPYLSDVCALGPNGSLLIYGHNMKNGSMFAPLKGYQKSEFYKEHSAIRFDTMEEEAMFEVIGAWLIPDADSEKVNELYNLVFPQSETEFADGWKAISKNLFVKTGLQPTYGKRLLVLITCDYAYDNSRLIVLSQQSNDIYG